MISCAHQYESCTIPDYERCGLCGTYHSTASLPPEQIYGVGYWNRPDHSSIRDQVYNLEVHEEGGVTKNDFVLQRVVVADRSAALEIGCAPGSLLRRLKQDAGFARVVGIDTDPGYEADIHDISGGDCDLLFGYFPDVTKQMNRSSFSFVVGCDVFEHVHEPADFLAESARLLKPDGQLVLMLPMVPEVTEILLKYPVEGIEPLPVTLITPEPMPDRFFHAAEHVYLHSASHMRQMLAAAGFGDVSFSRWTAGHDMVSARKGAE